MLSPARIAAYRLQFLRRYSSSSSRSSNGPSSIHSLLAAFRDSSSPFYIQTGTQGPSSPDASPCPKPGPSHSSTSSIELSAIDQNAAACATRKLLDLGYDPTSFWEQQIVWGFHDAFQHVNNVHYVRFFESGRIKWMVSVGNEIGGPAKAESMLKAKGVGFILKYIDVEYKRPVTYPDTLLIAHKPYIPTSYHTPPTPSHPIPRSHTQFNLRATAYSYAQSAIVAESDSVIVWYDYDNLRRCDPGEASRAVISGRIKESTVQ